MPFNFLAGDREQLFLMPPDMRDWLAPEHRARMLIDVVDELDMSPFEAAYRLDGRGGAAYDPKVMVALLLYSYWCGERSSRRIERACHEHVPCRVICGNLMPDHTSISRFRQRHEQALKDLLAQSVRVCAEAGLVQPGTIVIDGRKVAGNASLGANRTREGIEREIERWFDEAEQVDAAEDALYGADRRGDELPPELVDPNTRRERLKRAKAKLDAEAANDSRQQRYERIVEKREQHKHATGAYPRGRPPLPPQPQELKANITDPDSRILKGMHGFVQGYNTQVAVTADQIVIAAEIADEANDIHQLTPMIQAAQTMLTAVGIDERIEVAVADAGYGTEQELLDAEANHDAPEIFVAITNRRRGEFGERGKMPPPDSPRGRMHTKLKTERGKQVYKTRGHTVEGVFGQQQTVQRFNRLSRRGGDAARSELGFVNAVHNISKVITHRLRTPTPHPSPA